MKCPECHGCTKILNIGYRRYFYCSFCRQLYDLVGKEFIKTSDELTKTARQMHGEQI